jgi:phage-related baseplate assembly protein
LAVESGSASSVAPGELDTLETPLAKVTVTNPTSIIGRDAETDAELVKRCLLKKATWSPFGPRDAYEFAALSAQLSPGVPTTINRVAVSRFSSTGQVTVTCATPSGTPSGAELAAVVANIEAIARPDTVQATVAGATTHPTARVITIWSKGGTASLIAANAATTLAQMISTYPIGGISETEGGTGYLFADRIKATAFEADPTVFHVDLSDTTDLALGTSEVAIDSSTFVVRVV